MLAALDRHLSLRTVVWLFPLVFLIHDGEEVLLAEGWAARHLAGALAALPPRAAAVLARSADVTTAQFAAAVGFLLVLVVAAAWAGARSLRPGPGMNLFAAAVMLLFLNVWTHLGQSAFLRLYTPGVVTAVLVALPYALYTFRRLLRARLVTARWLGASALICAATSVPLLLLAHSLGRLIAP